MPPNCGFGFPVAEGWIRSRGGDGFGTWVGWIRYAVGSIPGEEEGWILVRGGMDSWARRDGSVRGGMDLYVVGWILGEEGWILGVESDDVLIDQAHKKGLQGDRSQPCRTSAHLVMGSERDKWADRWVSGGMGSQRSHVEDQRAMAEVWEVVTLLEVAMGSQIKWRIWGSFRRKGGGF